MSNEHQFKILEMEWQVLQKESETFSTWDTYVTPLKLAEMLNCSDRKVRQLAAEGIIPRSVKGKYHQFVCIRSYIRHLEEKRLFG